MKPIACVYIEGSETKLAVFDKSKEGVKILKTLSISGQEASPSEMESTDSGLDDLELSDVGDDISFDDLDKGDSEGVMAAPSDFETINAHLKEFNLSKLDFIPVVTEPVANYHTFEGEKVKDKKKQLQAIINDIETSKDTKVAPDSLDYIDLNGSGLLSVYLEGELPSVQLINSLAKENNKKFYKINSIKSAEVSLGYLVSKSNKFFPEDYSLVIYTGKEFSKLIFLEGQQIKHVGTSLDIGTENLHTYDVYFSKILLEMENGEIPRLDNVILCGEDTSENLILSFYGTFPEANVIELKFDDFDVSSLEVEEQEKVSAYSILIAAANEYYAEFEKEFEGINILPRHIKENQKIFQFGWHTIAVLPLMFLATYFFTFSYLSNNQKIVEMDQEIVKLKQLQIENQAILDKISYFNEKVDNFDNTLAILDSASAGSEVWTKVVTKTANFIERRRSFWIKSFSSANEYINIEGYSLSRRVLTRFADANNSSLLRNINYEPLRKHNAFKFSLRFLSEIKEGGI